MSIADLSKRMNKLIASLGSGISTRDEGELKEIAADLAALASAPDTSKEATAKTAAVRPAARKPAKRKAK